MVAFVRVCVGVEAPEKGAIIGRRAEPGRTALLDAAEELFATVGIDAVSDRRIAERAGLRNHSAVSYHFGTRTALILALVERSAVPVGAGRAELASQLPPQATAVDHLRCLILPVTYHLASLPVPCRRARLLHQIRTTPSTSHLLDDLARGPVESGLVEQLRRHLAGVPERVLAARALMAARMVVDVCAEYESRAGAATMPQDWAGFGHFLADAVLGLLSAPVSAASTFVPVFPAPDSGEP
ncbi:TetR/AcrR family transcriptional regulator [Nocardia takedensis]